jgi:hypothetical protein
MRSHVIHHTVNAHFDAVDADAHADLNVIIYDAASMMIQLLATSFATFETLGS